MIIPCGLVRVCVCVCVCMCARVYACGCGCGCVGKVHIIPCTRLMYTGSFSFETDDRVIKS